MIFFTSSDLYQVSSFNALRLGKYDGSYEVRNLTKHGDFGLGTFNGLAGEMVVVRGHVYQVSGFGDAAPPAPGTRTPFACVAKFRPTLRIPIKKPLSSSDVQAIVDKAMPNGIVAIHIVGQFKNVQARSFASQQKPYLPFAKISDRQSLFPYPDVAGEFVGFRMPKSAGKNYLNIPGYHFHFLTWDHKRGGHVLNYAIRSGAIELMPISKIAAH